MIGSLCSRTPAEDSGEVSVVDVELLRLVCGVKSAVADPVEW